MEDIQLKFGEYKRTASEWITTLGNTYFPDYLPSALDIYRPYITHFFELVDECSSSIELFKRINTLTINKGRIQYLRIFRKYFAPNLPVEMLKKKNKEKEIIAAYGSEFRKIEIVKKLHSKSEDEYDKILSAILYEYKDRGKKGYSLTTTFFKWFKLKFPDFDIKGPKSAGTDLQLYDYLPKYKKHKTPTDFIIFDKNQKVLAVGYARYDSDRGGSQEDDRIGGNRDKVTLIRQYNKEQNAKVKVIFLNDGPGLLLGSMWDDYSEIEFYGQGIALVTTLKMLNKRLTKEWLLS